MSVPHVQNRVAYVSAGGRGGYDDEYDLALTAWAEAGVAGEKVNWDDPAVDWSSYELAVVRSTWDYVERRDEFLAWSRETQRRTHLCNAAGVLERNTDKTYLRDLPVPTVPTTWLAPGDDVALPDHDSYVVKPTVSVAALDTVRTNDRAEAADHVRSLQAAGRTAMVQPYLEMVEGEGETSMLFFGKQFSHAVRKHPMLAPAYADDAAENLTAPTTEPAADLLRLADRLLTSIPEDLLYARVDVVRLPDGRPVLMEVELTEPYLFLRSAPQAAARFATAVRYRLDRLRVRATTGQGTRMV